MKPRPARSHFRRIRGLRYHFTRWGNPRRGAPVLLLHGYMDCGRSFQFLADLLGGERPLIAPDWRGFGRTDWVGGGYWFPDYLADLEAIVASFSPVRPVDLVGHSMGGNVASLYAGTRPERVRRLVNLEGFGLPATAPDEAPARYRRWLDELGGSASAPRYASFVELASQLQGRNPRLDRARAMFLARALGAVDPQGGVRLRADPSHRRVNPVLYRIEEARACWRAIEAPTLLVAGSESEYLRWLGPHAPEHYGRDIARLTTHTLDGAGHMLHHDAPERLAPLIERFLGLRHRSGSRRSRR